MKGKKVLLHTCCGVCAYACIERLKEEGFSSTAFFFNPNVQPQTEYLKRKDSAYLVAQTLGIEIIEGEYNPGDWLKQMKPYSQEKEGGQRCLLCYRMRLEAAFNLSTQEGYDYFTTTLTISPYKKSSAIIDVGKSLGGDKFLPFDFKKKDGFKKSIAAAKEINLYRQNYCGCLFSRRSTYI